MKGNREYTLAAGVVLLGLLTVLVVAIATSGPELENMTTDEYNSYASGYIAAVTNTEGGLCNGDDSYFEEDRTLIREYVDAGCSQGSEDRRNESCGAPDIIGVCPFD